MTNPATKPALTAAQYAFIAALRSGEYKQGRGFLMQNDCYCVMGVACEVAIKSGIPIYKTIHEWGRAQYDGEYEFCPADVVEFLGFNSRSGRFEGPRDFSFAVSLMDLNDARQFTFAEMADFIEKNSEVIFTN